METEKPDYTGLNTPNTEEYFAYSDTPPVDLGATAKNILQKRHLSKDQYKADQCTQFIGRGSGSTAEYGRLFQEAGIPVNSGRYTRRDVVFVSANGSRTGRMDPDYKLLQCAIDAEATILTDSRIRRPEGGHSYNIGEQQVADYLRSNGYMEWSDEYHGIVTRWCKNGSRPMLVQKSQNKDVIERWSSLLAAHRDFSYGVNEVRQALLSGIVEARSKGLPVYRDIGQSGMNANPVGFSIFIEIQNSTATEPLPRVRVATATGELVLRQSLSEIEKSRHYKEFIGRPADIESKYRKMMGSQVNAPTTPTNGPVIRNIRVESKI